MRIFVPQDSAAVALGADRIAQAIAREAAARDLDVTLVRNGSRGLFWLEPLVEIETASGRVGFGPLTLADVPALFGDIAAHPKHLGLVEEIPFLKKQQRLTFARCGIANPLDLDAYRALGGFAGLDKARAMSGAEICAEVKASGLRGRGGAGFPTGIKWETVRTASADQKYIVCNADEGDSGTFADRLIMEADPLVVIEGMTIAAIAVGATKGYIYIRSEYPDAIVAMNAAIAAGKRAGYLGARV